MNVDPVKSKIEAALPDVRLKTLRDSLVLENPNDLPPVARFLRDSTEFAMDYLASMTAADYLDSLEAVYHLYSMEKKTGPLVLRVRVPRGEPRIPSLVPIYRGAEFQEREVYDMFGIFFENHPDLRRIFMWEGFEGFPMRKDYQQEDSETLEWEDLEWLEKKGVKVPEPMKAQAEELKRQGKRALAQRPGQPEPE